MCEWSGCVLYLVCVLSDGGKDACAFLYSISRKREVCILQCTAAWQPGGQKHSVCLSIWPYALPRIQVKISNKIVQGSLCNVVT